MRVTRRWEAVAAIAVVAAVAASALGGRISSIGVLTPAADGGAIQSNVFALSSDGTYAVGSSNGQNIAGTSTMSQAVIWSAASGLVQLPNNPEPPRMDLATSARGVLVKANGEIGVAWYYTDPNTGDYRMNHYTASPGALGSGTSVTSPGTSNVLIGTYNAARNYNNGPGNTLSNEWSIAGQRLNSLRGIISLTGSYSDSGGGLVGKIYNVASRVPTGSGRGFGAGYDLSGTTGNKRRAMFGVTASTQFYIPGTAGTAGQNEVLGMSPYTTTAAGSGVIVGYDVGANGNDCAFYYTMGTNSGGVLSGSRTLLPRLDPQSPTEQSQAIDARLIGGKWIIGGFASDGTTEQAVLWDNTGVWDSTGNPMIVKDLLAAAGVDVSAWSSLSRVTSMSDDGGTLAGWGVWAEDGSTRGFVATMIPEPATLALLTLGGLAFLRRRRH